ncbi:exodeoxyribonuclease V subunit alpha [Photorhabdus heterorhabditis]|uniref:exodeoxyribonuclease V subunit alpha n=1 Tax=Photorhabdus heterorhabditis TaxID=880156 RepID=UPI0015623EA9|nr:exodeoxyribonuclease V subunit alpha [Photorhabdus heterorhabditis]NRN28343.1 exodeoxyribonuclease V subunit alpha [Photorhabdus heterorhabditis subsp. aluminescens]
MISLLQQAVDLRLLRPLDLQFAHALIGDEDPALLLVMALLSAEAGAGHVCLPVNRIMPEYFFDGRQREFAEQLWQVAGNPDEPNLREVLEHCAAISDGFQPTPVVLSHNRLYLQRMWQSECQVAAFFSANQSTDNIQEEQLRAILDELFTLSGEAMDWQKMAAAVAATSRVSVISGGPGTGKTTTVAKLLAALIKLNPDKNMVIRLAAPTGKAAARLTESLNSAVRKLPLTEKQFESMPDQAQTIHRLLGAQPDSQRLRHDRDNPLSLDVLVVDEASMVDLPMMARLIDALPSYAKIVLLGDRDQLASVEAGAVLGDICRFAEMGYSAVRAEQLSRLTGCQLVAGEQENVPEVRDRLCLLRRSYRFDVDSGIGQLAAAVNQGKSRQALSILQQPLNDICFYRLSDDEDYQRLLIETVSGYRSYLQLVAKQASVKAILDEFNRYRLLCALREGPFGVSGLNERIEQLLHRQGLIRRPTGIFSRGYAGRPIMISRNDSTLSLFNGDIGIMLRDENNELRAYFQLPDGQIKGIQPSRLPQHETAYVMTVHKSQGSEFEHTALVLPTQFTPVVSRELVYTAMTRAREKLTLYAHDAVLRQAIQTPTQRRSGLAERLSLQTD